LATARTGTCPCGLALAYSACCGRWYGGALYLQAPDAQSLMRSRYSAYVLGLDAYLLETWHASARPAAIEPADPALRWLGLELRRHTVLDADHAEVEFVARCKLAGRAQRLHEVSRFVREAGVWYYLGAEEG
jgi:SEC-C motif domain protein